MGHELSKVIQYFFSILFPILAYIIGGLANLEFSYHHYIKFNLYHSSSSDTEIVKPNAEIVIFGLGFCFDFDIVILRVWVRVFALLSRSLF